MGVMRLAPEVAEALATQGRINSDQMYYDQMTKSYHLIGKPPEIKRGNCISCGAAIEKARCAYCGRLH